MREYKKISKRVYGENSIPFRVTYGHSSLDRYFVRVYHSIKEDPLTQYREKEDWEIWHEDQSYLYFNHAEIFNAAIKLGRATFERLKSGELKV